jgi:ABC-2 type transport system ATP-binding protein
VDARIEGAAAAAVVALDGVYGVAGVEGRDHELTISVDDGSAAIGPIAIALHTASVRVRDLTLRTPTLDDVFLELTGAHFDTGFDAGFEAAFDSGADTGATTSEVRS